MEGQDCSQPFAALATVCSGLQRASLGCCPPNAPLLFRKGCRPPQLRPTDASYAPEALVAIVRGGAACP
eukprot:14178376-Alexandrium_andersonii.AAC.1